MQSTCTYVFCKLPLVHKIICGLHALTTKNIPNLVTRKKEMSSEAVQYVTFVLRHKDTVGQMKHGFNIKCANLHDTNQHQCGDNNNRCGDRKRQNGMKRMPHKQWQVK